MPERICATCKHWDKTGDRLGNKAYVDTPEGWGFCVRTETGKSELIDVGTLAAAYDVDEWSASLATSPQFGCVQWEAQDA